ncbi:hypothetical protein NKH36_09585 [Mesorhizobium sp. M1312]|uniref:hypothetical protein n=1 Tax=unclassified Mesorhizobium TaxID=325217 RepID=UPI003338F776
MTVARVTGVALLALAVSSWMGRQDQGRSSPLAGMLTYNVLAAIYLAYLRTEGAQVGNYCGRRLFSMPHWACILFTPGFPSNLDHFGNSEGVAHEIPPQRIPPVGYS